MSFQAHTNSEQYPSSNQHFYDEQDISDSYDPDSFLQNLDLYEDIKPVMSEITEKPQSTTSQLMPTVARTPTFAALLKAVPIKLEAITKLTAVGDNFDVWEADIMDYLTFISDATEYLKPGALPNVKGYQEDMANGVNSVIHWTIDRQLGMRIRKVSMYPSVRMDELRRLFSGVSYAN